MASYWQRRDFLRSAAATLATSGLGIGFSGVVDGSTNVLLAGTETGDITKGLPLESFSNDEFNPFLSNDTPRMPELFYTVMQPDAAQNIVGRLTQAYKNTREYKYLEWALMYGFVQWRMLPRSERRVKVALIHQKFAALARKDFPDKPAGYVWGAMFTGLEILTLGIMNSLNRIPAFEEQLQSAESQHGDYFYGLARLLRGKIHVKAPPFPVSIGDMRKGLAYIEKAGEKMSGVFGPWYVIYAEALYLSNKQQEAQKVLQELRTQAKARDYGTDFLLHMSIRDAESFEAAIADGSYDRYLFDPLLAPIQGIRRY